jgi:hypothetical protein
MQKYKQSKNSTQMSLEELELMSLMVPSIKTTLITCSYYLEVSFEHWGFTFGSKIPPAKLGINIFAPVFKNQV